MFCDSVGWDRGKGITFIQNFFLPFLKCTFKCQTVLSISSLYTDHDVEHVACMRGFKVCRTKPKGQILSRNREQTKFVLNVTDDFISLRCPYLVLMYLWINFFYWASTIFDLFDVFPHFTNNSLNLMTKTCSQKEIDPKTFSIGGQYANH